MEFVKVKKGNIETQVNSKQLSHYKANGWVEVKVEEEPKPKTYDNYNMNQLKAIANNRNITVNVKEAKSKVVDKLIHYDKMYSQVTNKPTNQGFTDNLIIE